MPKKKASEPVDLMAALKESLRPITDRRDAELQRGQMSDWRESHDYDGSDAEMVKRDWIAALDEAQIRGADESDAMQRHFEALRMNREFNDAKALNSAQARWDGRHRDIASAVVARSDTAGIGWSCTNCGSKWSGSRNHTCTPITTGK